MKRLLVCTLSSVFLSLMTAGAHAAVLVAEVDVTSQTMQVIHYGQVIHTWRVSTARSGYITPAGAWRPKRMHKMWYSRKYHNSPMPHSIFFYGGYAIHGTDAVGNLGRPASHGCVRLHPTNAKTLYNLVQTYGSKNTRIVLVN